MHTCTLGRCRENKIRFHLFPLKTWETRNSPKRVQRFDICSPVSVNRLGEDDVRCVCVCVRVRFFLRVLICDLHVHVKQSSCGVSYIWQEVVGGRVCVCVCLPSPDEAFCWTLLLVIQAGREPCGVPRAAQSPVFPCFPPAAGCRAGWWPGWLPAELAALLFL